MPLSSRSRAEVARLDRCGATHVTTSYGSGSGASFVSSTRADARHGQQLQGKVNLLERRPIVIEVLNSKAWLDELCVWPWAGHWLARRASRHLAARPMRSA